MGSSLLDVALAPTRRLNARRSGDSEKLEKKKGTIVLWSTEHYITKRATHLRGVVVVALAVAVAAAHGRGHLVIHEHVPHHPRLGVPEAADVLGVVLGLVGPLELVQIERVVASAGLVLCSALRQR